MRTEEKPFILLVEDEREARELTKKQFEALGFYVIPAPTFEQAVSRMHRSSGEGVAIVDINLPGKKEERRKTPRD